MYDSSLFEIISSASKLRVLKVLCEYNSYLSMRQIESFSGLAIRSVQLAVRALAQDKIIVVVKKDKKIFYMLNSTHHFAEVLKKIFTLIEQELIFTRSKTNQKKAEFLLQFVSQQIELLRKAS